MFTKHSRFLILLVTVIIFVLSVAFISWQLQRKKHTMPQPNSTRHVKLVTLPPENHKNIPSTQPHRTNIIPPALPDEHVRTAVPDVNAPAGYEASLPKLSYDPTQSFAANLERFRLFCDNDADPRTLDGRTRSFVAELIKQAKANGSVIKAALLSKQGSPPYRNILLACLLQSELDDKQDIAWSIALDQAENPTVRRTAAFVLKELPQVRSQPQQFLRLLADPDDQVKVFALQSAGAHMNDTVYQEALNLASTSDDIHVRLAALSAIGQTANADKNDYLTDLITQQQTSAADKFSEASLVKRAAIAALDVSVSDAYATVRSAALDPEEDPGVRRRAILTCAQTPHPDTLDMITNLLHDAGTEDALIIKACVQGLLLIGDPAGMKAVQDKLAQTKDPEIRALISQLLIKQPEQLEK